MNCTCSNPKCPYSQHFNGCQHCMCLSSPDFGPNAVIGYAGPIYQVCCKCSHSVLICGGTTSTTTEYVGNGRWIN